MKMTFEQYGQLQDKGLTPEQIQSIAQSRGIEMPSEGLLGGLLKSTIVRPAVQLGRLAGAGIAKVAGVDNQKILDTLSKDTTMNVPLVGDINVGAQKSFGQGGGMQIAGQALEAGSTFAPLGRIATGITKVAGKVLPKVASKTAGYIGAGATAGYGMDVASSLQQGKDDFTPGIGTALGGVIPAVPSIIKPISKVAKFTTSQITGLNPETLTTLLTNPKAVSAEQANGLTRLNLANQVKDAFDARIADLSHTGKGYETIRNIQQKIKLQQDIPTEILNKYGVKIENGKILVSPESTPLKAGDKSAIEDFVAQYGHAQELTPNGILNVRKALDNMASWDSTKSSISTKISREMRARYDEIAKKSIQGLDALDKQYAPEVSSLKQLRKDFFDANGELKDVAINKIANSVGKGKDKLLARLEDLVPGITQKAQILKALEDIGGAGGMKVGTYMRAGAIGGSFMANPILGAVALMASTPSISVPIIKAVGVARGWADDAVTRLVSKLADGRTLTPSELVMYRASMEEHLKKLSPGDQFLETPLGKKTVDTTKAVASDIKTSIKNPSQIKTRAQLTDIYNRAHSKTTPSVKAKP